MPGNNTQDDDLHDDELNVLEDDDGEPNPGGEDRGDLVDPASTKAPDKPEHEAPAGDDELDDDAGEKPGKRMPSMIPKARFDEVNDTLKEMRRQNELLLQAVASKTAAPAAEAAATPQQQEAAPIDLDALEKEYVNALLDGDVDKATGLRKAIRSEENRIAVEQALGVQDARNAQSLFTAEVSSIYADYPALNNKGEAPDAKAIADVIEWRDFLVDRRGLPLHTALRQAADRVAAERGWSGESPKAETSDRRPEAQRRRNAQANLDQPPALEAGLGERASRSRQMDVSKMTDAEFAALPEADKARLRGD